MTVTYQVVNLSTGGGSNNLLINPRGKINQANESDGVLSPGKYFCDGWKAGSAGAEVYRDSDGFRLISGSIVQLVPNNLDVGRQIRGNMDIISGTPIIRINGGGDDELSNTQPYITFEVVGDNSKFTRLILAESVELPVYQQSLDELAPCEKHIKVIDNLHVDVTDGEYYWLGFERMNKAPAISFIGGTLGGKSIIKAVGVNHIVMRISSNLPEWCGKLIIDARP